MTTYYTDASRPDDTGDGLTPATAKKTVGATVTVSGADSDTPHTINIADGTYEDDPFSLTSAYHSGISILGASREGTIITSSSAKALWAGSGNTGGTVKKLSLRVGGANTGVQPASGENWSFDEVAIESLSDHDGNLMQLANGTGVSLNNVYFRHKYSATSYPILVSGSCAGEMTNCVFSAAGHANFSSEPTWVPSTTWNIYNNVFLDSYRFGIAVNTATVNLKNNFILGGSIGSNAACIGQFGGTINADNNYLVYGTQNGAGNWIYEGGGTLNEGAGDNANIKTNENPRFKRPTRKGYIIPRNDDSAETTYTEQMAAKLALHGFKGVWGYNYATMNADRLPAIRVLVEGGVIEICSHGYTHSKMVTGDLYSVTKAAETITIDRTADTITLSGGGTVTGFKAKTLAAIQAELEGFGATVTEDKAGSDVKEESLGECIANGTGVNALTILRDATGATGLEKVELADSRDLITSSINDLGDVIDGQTGETYQCSTHVATYNTSDEDSRAALRAIGYRCGSSANTAADTTRLADYDLYQIGGAGSPFLGENEANTRKIARAIAVEAAVSGTGIFVLTHSTGGITIEQWGWICEEWAKFGDDINVTSFQLMANEIRDGGNWADQGDGTYKQTYDYPDIAKTAASPLRDAGTDVGLTEDGIGTKVPQGSAPDIGAREFRRQGAARSMRPLATMRPLEPMTVA